MIFPSLRLVSTFFFFLSRHSTRFHDGWTRINDARGHDTRTMHFRYPPLHPYRVALDDPLWEIFRVSLENFLTTDGTINGV